MSKLSDHAFKCYMKAGKAVGHALKLAKQIARPGTKLLDLATVLEKDIIDNGADGLSFPANISLDEQAAHYSPLIGDELILPDKGLLKIDLGSHVDGYVADAAVTVNLGDDGGVYQDLIDAATDALYDAIANFKVGVNVSDIGRAIQSAITSHDDFRPVSNLGGHQLKQWSLHAGVFVPNVSQSTTNYKIQEGDQFAVEPFATNGYGAVENGDIIAIYRLKGMKKTKRLPQRERLRLRNFKRKFESFPFSPRWVDFIPEKQVNRAIKRYYQRGILEGYHVFVERNKGLVSQAEHTLIVKDGRAIPTTWWEDFNYTDLYKD